MNYFLDIVQFALYKIELVDASAIAGEHAALRTEHNIVDLDLLDLHPATHLNSDFNFVCVNCLIESSQEYLVA